MSTEIELFQLVGCFHILPHVSFCYKSDHCVWSLSLGWLMWGVSITRKTGMQL
jgi:hypothetical protein